jgi:hypothetical protein
MKSNAPRQVSLSELSAVKMPSATRTWQPIAHHELFELFCESINKRGYKIVNHIHTTSHDNRRYFGRINITKKKDANSDFLLTVGVRNSHDKTYAAGGVAGSHVMVCSNGIFSGEHKFTERHTSQVNLRLDQQVERVVESVMGDYKTQDERFSKYREFELDDAMAHDIIIRSIDKQVISASDVPHVIKQWRTPDHPEFSKDGHTMWRLFNAYTDFFKSVNVFDLPRRGDNLYDLVDTVVGLKQPTLAMAA